MRSPQECQQASREAKTRKPITSVTIIHFLFIHNDNRQQVVFFLLPFLQVRKTCFIRKKVIQCHATAVIVKWINTLLLLLGLVSLFCTLFFLITGTCKRGRWLGGGGLDNIWTISCHHPLPPALGIKVSAGPESQNTRSRSQQLGVT